MMIENIAFFAEISMLAPAYGFNPA